MSLTWTPLASRQASSNMRHYMAEASLPQIRLAPISPPMPPENHKSHRNNLTVRPERYRRLEQMYRLKDQYFEEDAMTFNTTYVPSLHLGTHDTDPDTGERISIPCSGYDIQSFSPPPLRHIEEMGVSWLENYALRTMQRIIQILPAFSTAKQWSINRPDDSRDMDRTLFRYFMWNKASNPDTISGPEDPCSLIIAYQPPWILSPQDLKQFVKTSALPIYHERHGSVPPQYNSAQRVWAKLWDVCREKNCPWFILTNYSQWVFGAFSRGWTRGFVSEIKDIDAREPSVLQCMLFWFISSMNLPDIKGFAIPEVPEVVQFLRPDVSTPVQTPRILPTTPQEYAPSESFWSGQSEEAGSSAGLDDDGIVVNSPPRRAVELVGRRGVQMQTTDIPVEWIQHWLHNGETPALLPEPSIPEQPSPAPSDWSGTSITTTTARNMNGFLSIIPPMGPHDGIR